VSAGSSNGRSRWLDAWPDAVAFIAGLAVAWWAGWQTADLVWGLWLSSLLVGYTMILWAIFSPGLRIGRGVMNDWTQVAAEPLKSAAGLTLITVAGLFMLAFFTVHFGGFHFVHSVFLNGFFPVLPNAGRGDFPAFEVYQEVFRRYWLFVPLAFMAERSAFRWPEEKGAVSPDIGVSADAIARRKNSSGLEAGGMMFAPYKNVVRLHLLIFFFAFAHFLKWENFAIYAVVYAVYFFPWRLLRKPADEKV
jgi:hypothetical protein